MLPASHLDTIEGEPESEEESEEEERARPWVILLTYDMHGAENSMSR